MNTAILATHTSSSKLKSTYAKQTTPQVETDNNTNSHSHAEEEHHHQTAP
jgi:hypothetical protein